jgi:hypothetical protein
MSPEQLQGKEADARSDLFSFGCVLYEMLTGKRAFEGESAASVIAAILEREPAPLDIAPPLERVVRRCLAKDPDERFQTARDLKTALDWALEQQPAAAPAKPRIGVAIAAGILLAGALGGWVVSRFRDPAGNGRVLRLHIAPPAGGRFTGNFTTGGLAISPDGKTAAYVASVNGKTGLWVRPLDGATARLLPGTENAMWPFWSPDSKSIGFIVSRGAVSRVELAGGIPTQVVDFGALVLRGASWGADGNIVYAALAGLFRVPASGGGKSALLAKPDTARGEDAYSWPQLLSRWQAPLFCPKPQWRDQGSICRAARQTHGSRKTAEYGWQRGIRCRSQGSRRQGRWILVVGTRWSVSCTGVQSSNPDPCERSGSACRDTQPDIAGRQTGSCRLGKWNPAVWRDRGGGAIALG